MVDAERTLFAGDLGTDVLWGVVAAGVTAAIGLWVGIRSVTRADFSARWRGFDRSRKFPSYSEAEQRSP